MDDVDLHGENFFRICEYNFDLCVWIVQVFDDKMRVIRSRVVYEKGNERVVAKFSVFFLIVDCNCYTLELDIGR